MHPEFVHFVDILNDNGIAPWIYTNGDFLTDKMIDQLSKRKLESMTISGHMEMDKRIALWERCKAAGVNTQCQVTLTNPLNLAGQLELDTPYFNKGIPLGNPMEHCRFLKEDWGIVLYNGDLTVCCYDFEGYGVFGNIFKDDVSISPKVFSLCSTCNGHPGNVV